MSDSERDFFKVRALKELQTKKQSESGYPIGNSDLLILDKCPICGSAGRTVVSETYLNQELCFFQTSVCGSCTATFRSVSPALSWFKKCWAEIYTGQLEVFNPPMEKIRAERYQKYAELLKSFRPGGRLLDIGAGYGTGANVLQQNGFDVEVVEAEVEKANYVQKHFGIPVVADSIETLVDADSKYDLIVFSHCLEHLDDPKAALKTVHQALKEDGILYLEVPVLKNSVNWSDAFYLTHKLNFSEDVLKSFVESEGFKIEKSLHDRHSSHEPWDFGLVLSPQEAGASPSFQWPSFSDELPVVRKLYRDGLPEALQPSTEDEVIRYSVGQIEQFFQTVKLDKWKPAGPNAEGFIEFVAIGDNIGHH